MSLIPTPEQFGAVLKNTTFDRMAETQAAINKVFAYNFPEMKAWRKAWEEYNSKPSLCLEAFCKGRKSKR